MKNYVLLGCCIFLVTGLIAQDLVQKGGSSKLNGVTAAASDSGKPSANTLLWEISGNGLQQPSYLFGTMHLLCAEDARLSDNLKKVIKESDQIYFEIDMDNMMEMIGALKYVKMTNGTTLPDLLTAEEYAKVKSYFERNPSILPLKMMEGFKPYFISSLISEQKMDCKTKEGMEQSIMNESRQYKKEILGLETIQFQASVFDSIPYEQQAKELVKYIDSVGKNSRVAEELVAVYKTQDLKKIEELTSKEEGGVSEFIDVLLYDRNADWVEKMKRIMVEKRVLFAVGAAHLPGEKGVLTLLKKNGFTVTPLANIVQPGESL